VNLDALGGPYDTVFDVGGNVGDFSEQARAYWPAARIVSFEPVPVLAKANRQRAAGRWTVEQAAISNEHGTADIYYCENQHSASTMQEPGPLRRERLGIRDRHTKIGVITRPLDDWLDEVDGRLLVKIDVEGHEQQVLEGALLVLARAATVVVECQQDPTIFLGSPEPRLVDALLEASGLQFAGVVGAFADRDGRVLQFDGIWQRL
jgi:FkbM family methyltransferase